MKLSRNICRKACSLSLNISVTIKEKISILSNGFLLKHKSCRGVRCTIMIEQIRKCQKCSLCFNQKPLLDLEKDCQVFWVGLSAKKIKSYQETPLSSETNTGMLIHKIEKLCENVSFYKTNLVKCLPLTEQKKLRYPNRKEINCCFEHLVNEINTMSPKIVFFIGGKSVFIGRGKSQN